MCKLVAKLIYWLFLFDVCFITDIMVLWFLWMTLWRYNDFFVLYFELWKISWVVSAQSTFFHAKNKYQNWQWKRQNFGLFFVSRPKLHMGYSPAISVSNFWKILYFKKWKLRNHRSKRPVAKFFNLLLEILYAENP